MVLSLFDYCRVGIRNALENGIPLPVHQLPLKFRQLILDMVLMHGTINGPACLEVLGSEKFVCGISSLNTLAGPVDDHRFLDRVATTVSPKDETLGSDISELRLNLHLDKYGEVEMNLRSIVRLIAQCPRLVKLELAHRYEDDGHYIADYIAALGELGCHGPGLLNATELLNPCLSVLENLETFSFSGVFDVDPVILNLDYPILEFKKLTTLSLENCLVERKAWRNLLNVVRSTLTSLRMENMKFHPYFDNSVPILPIPLPNLKSLHVGQCTWMDHAEEFVRNLRECRELECVHLCITYGYFKDKNIGEELLMELSGLNANLEIFFYLNGIRESQRFEVYKLVNLLGEKVKHFECGSHYLWTEDLTSVVQHVVDKCQNLITLELDGQLEEPPELGQTKMSLAPLFSNEERARKFRELHLHGDYDESILKLIFENCVNLDKLQVFECPQLSDHHLFELARCGVRLSELWLCGCNGITDEGVISILANSGNKLQVFDADQSSQVTDYSYCAAIELCRYLKWSRFGTEELKAFACTKGFKKNVSC